MNEKSDSEKVDATVRTILSVSHDELKRREVEWKRKREKEDIGCLGY
jgi:hypothetical protein